MRISRKAGRLASFTAGAGCSLLVCSAFLNSYLFGRAHAESAGASTHSFSRLAESDSPSAREIKKHCISRKGIEAIKKFEGFREKAYFCPSGVLTVGYGHATGVSAGDSLTLKDAEIILLNDLKSFEDVINDSVNVPLMQNQYDALVSFAYNIGENAFKKSTLLSKLNNCDYEGASGEFGRWIYSNGEILNGLRERRNREREFFNSLE